MVTVIERGFDTETVQGYARMICTNEKGRNVNSLDEILGFLREYEGATLWTWNLQYDAQAILKYFGKGFCRRLWDNDTRVGESAHGVGVNYIPGKFLSFNWGDDKFKAVRLLDIAQFYGWTALESQARKFLGEGKQDIGQWVKMSKEYSAGRLSLDRLNAYYDAHLPEIEYYCTKDALLTLRLAQFMRSSFNKMEIPFGHPISQAMVAERYINNYNGAWVTNKQGKDIKVRRYPRIWDNWLKYHNAAQLAYHGGMFETLRRGYYPKEFHKYDINSAYPSVMVWLPHWGNGFFRVVDEPTEGAYGWYVCDFDCRWVPFDDLKGQHITQFFDGEEVSVTALQKRVIFPAGRRRQMITSWEYEWMKKNGYSCAFWKGCEWVETSKKFKNPFGFMAELYNQRLQIKREDKDDARQMALKIVINSAYGKTAQAKHGMGRLTNFFYASFITAGCRLQIADVVHKHPQCVYDIATDGIITSREIPRMPISERLGEWSHEIYDAGLFVGSGIRQMWKEDKYVTAARGLDGREDFPLLKNIEMNRRKDSFLVTKTRPLQLGEVLEHSKVLNWSQLNCFTDVSRTLNVNTDTKHIWSDKYGCWQDFLDYNTIARPLIVENDKIICEG